MHRGFHRVLEGLAEVGKRLGVKYHLSTKATRVNVSPTDGRVTGITPEAGEVVHADIVHADIVLVNVDLVLLPPSLKVNLLHRSQDRALAYHLLYVSSSFCPRLSNAGVDNLRGRRT
jgi:phytoene dehydrogenase-like protein